MTCKKSPPAPTTAFSPTPERRRMSGEPSPTKLLFGRSARPRPYAGEPVASPARTAPTALEQFSGAPFPTTAAGSRSQGAGGPPGSSLHLPASHKPGDDLLRLGSEVGAQQSLSLELLLRVADQDPTQGHGGQTRAVPERRPETISMVRLLLPYQLLSVTGAQSVVGSSARTERFGKRSPFRRGRPI